MGETLPASIVNRVAKELRDLQTRPEEGIRVSINEDNLGDIQAEYDGPAGTPFEGGVFRMRLVLGPDFPNAPPKGYFFTKIFHPNVSKSGDICVNVLKADWKSTLPLRHIFVVIRCLLPFSGHIRKLEGTGPQKPLLHILAERGELQVEPFPESALNEEAGKQLLECYEDYARHARLMTSIHARPTKRWTPLTDIGGGNVVNTLSEEAPAGPEVKKPKGAEGSAPKGVAATEKSKAAAARKRGLKRL